MFKKRKSRGSINSLGNFEKKSLNKTIALTLAVFVPIMVIYSMFNRTNAAWYDDAWQYRSKVTFTNSGTAQTDQRVLVTINTQTLISAGKMQATCGDSRFINASGTELLYYLDTAGGACNTTTTNYWILMPDIPKGTTIIYHYYGNPTALPGTQSQQFTQAAFSPDATPALATEEQGPKPRLYWHFDEANGTTLYDSSNNGKTGTLTSNSLWAGNQQCASNRCVSLFSGYATRTYSGDADIDPGTGSFSVSTWFSHQGATPSGSPEVLVARYVNAGYKIYMDTGGNMCFGIDDDASWGPDDSTCTYGKSYADNAWHNVVATKTGTTSIKIYVDGKLQNTKTSLTATGSLSGTTPTLYVGADVSGTNIWQGFVDEFKIFNFEKTLNQAKQELTGRASTKGAAASFGEIDYEYLNRSQVGYWRLDESSGDAVDSSGNGLTLTNTGTMTYDFGKYGNGAVGNGTARYLAASVQPGNIYSVSFWVKPTNTNNYFINLSGSASVSSTASVVNATGFTTPDIYVNGVKDATLVVNSWNHIAIVSQEIINANSFYIGGVGASYLLGTIDEVRLYARKLTRDDAINISNFGPGPVAEYKFDENTGSVVLDTSGNNYNGYLGGNTAANMPVWASGKEGAGLRFDGANDYVKVNDGTGSKLDSAEAMTVEAWIYPNAATVSGDRFLDKDQTTGWWFGAGGGTMDVAFNRGGVNVIDSSNNVLVQGAWTHIAITVDTNASTENYIVYVNGRKRNTANSTTVIGTNNLPLTIGASSTNSNPFDGMLDHVRIYNYARTPAQVLEDLNAGAPVPTSPFFAPLLWWKFDEGYGTTGRDSGIGSYTVTLNMDTRTNAGKFGSAFNATGASWGTRADDPALDFAATDDFTLSMWVKSASSANPASRQYLLSKTGGGRPGYGMYFETNGRAVFGVDDDNTWNPDDTVSSIRDIYDGQWHQIVATKEQTKYINIYIDGVLENINTTLTAIATLSNTRSVLLGDLDTIDNGSEFIGTIDDVKIYRNALTPEQVKIEYNQGMASSLGALSTESNGKDASFGSDRSACVPGDTSTCNPPTGWWNMDENTGTTINDISSYSQNGTQVGAGIKWSRGKFGMGTEFSGGTNSAYLNILDANQLDLLNGSFSLFIWVKNNKDSTTDNMVAYKGALAANSVGYRLQVASTTTGVPTLYISNGTSYIVNGLAGTTDVCDGNWHYVGFTWNPAVGAKIYVDGAVDAQTAVTSAVNMNSGFSLMIGGYTSTNYTLDGTVDELKTYQYERTPEQVAWDYNRGAPSSWYKFDECTGTTAYNSALTADGTAQSPNGTITPGTGRTVGSCGSGVSTEMWNGGTRGKIDGSLFFGGSSEYVNASTGTGNNIDGTSFSSSLWVKRTTVSTDDYLLTKGNTLNTDEKFYVAVYGQTYSDKAGCALMNRSIVLSNTLLTDGDWHNITCTYNMTSGVMKIYIDGIYENQGSTGNTTGLLNTNSKNLYLGRYDLGGGPTIRYFAGTGQIDDVRIYKYELTPAQVNTIFNSGASVRFAN